MDKKLKIASAIGAGLLLLGAGAFGGAVMFPKSVEVPVEKVVEVPVETIVTVEKNVTVEVPVETIVTKELPYAHMKELMKFVEDNVDKDVSEDYIIFEFDAKMDAEAYIRDNFKSLLKDNDFFDDGAELENYRTSEVSIKKIYDAEIESRDFEDKDLTLSYDVQLRAKEDGEDASYHNFTFVVPFENGKMIDEDIEVSLS